MGAVFLLLALSSPAATQVLGIGRMLVARRELSDPNFVQTVVLLLQHRESGSWGVIINRPSRAPLSLVLKELEEAKERSDLAFWGGPVARTGAIALLRSPSKPEESQTVFGDVHRLLTRKGLQKALREGAGAARLRVYLGYAGWGAGQLENEVEWGMWHTLRAEAALVFDSDPDKVWPRLIRQFETRYAWNLPAIYTEILPQLTYSHTTGFPAHGAHSSAAPNASLKVAGPQAGWRLSDRFRRFVALLSGKVDTLLLRLLVSRRLSTEVHVTHPLHR